MNRVERARDSCRVRLGEGGQRQAVVQSLDLITKAVKSVEEGFQASSNFVGESI